MTVPCSCGYEADSPTDLADHLSEVFTPCDDVAPDGQIHAEAAREGHVLNKLTLTCLCGFSSDRSGMDEHFSRVFTPGDGIGLDGSKHVPEPIAAER